jgi:hypothetical protein
MEKMKIFGIICGGLLLVALGANAVVAQGSHFEDRDSCIANCRAMAARGPTLCRRSEGRPTSGICKVRATMR